MIATGSAGSLDVIRPADPRYEQARHVYSASGAPAAVVRVRDAGEVPDALQFALQNGGPFSVRSGGHGISSIATNVGGTVIDLSRLNHVEVLGGGRVRVGPGARWGRVAHKLYPHGLAISSGDSGDVGVGGLATTGGLGLLGRAQGLTIDHLVAAEIVTADGRRHRVSAEKEPDLFWAIRGAGANFGIATAFEFEAAPIPVVAHASLVFVPSDLAGFLEQWGQTVEQAPHKISAFLYTMGRDFARATVVYAGEDEDAAAALEPFATLPGMSGAQAQMAPYPNVLMTTSAPHTGQQRAHTRSGLAVHLDRETSRRIANAAETVDMLQIRSVGGVINGVPPDATAYAHRHQNFSVVAVSTAPQVALNAAWDPVHQRMDGMYLSFESEHTLASLAEAFPERTLARLRALKSQWDPERVFTQNFDLSEHDAPQPRTANSHLPDK